MDGLHLTLIRFVSKHFKVQVNMFPNLVVCNMTTYTKVTQPSGEVHGESVWREDPCIEYRHNSWVIDSLCWGWPWCGLGVALSHGARVWS